MPTTRSFWSAAGERLHGLHSFLKYIMPTYSATNVMAVTCIQAKAAIIGKEKAKIRKRFPGFCDYCINGGHYNWEVVSSWSGRSIATSSSTLKTSVGLVTLVEEFHQGQIC